MKNPIIESLDSSIQEMKARLASWSDAKSRARDSLTNAENNIQQCVGAIAAYEHLKSAFEPMPAPMAAAPEEAPKPPLKKTKEKTKKAEKSSAS